SLALLEATHCFSENSGRGCMQFRFPYPFGTLSAGFFNPFVGLVDVLDVPFEHEQIRRTLSVYLQRTTIVPLDSAFNLLAIQKNNHHLRVSIDLFLVIKDLRISFVGRRNSFLNLNRCVLLWGAVAIAVARATIV